MPHALSPLHRLTLGLLTACALAGAAQAEQADRLKPMNAESDNLRYDDARQLSIFTGNVVITKGTIVIRGAQVEVRQDAQGHQFGVVLGSPGYFKQKREGLNEFIEGEAKRIEYDSSADKVRFIGDAVLRRYLGTQLNDETRGSVIVYDNRSEVFTVESSPAGATPGNPSGRVRATLTPVPREGQPAPAPAPAPTPLRPSGELGGGRP
ncbi:lipopolysaccharide transport periplasmic protein LptA [Hydrogenophaga sp. YM1]|uniref:lipopolysaccharide transport periplasmic protein LptA n=1 Tax=Hydrogenophaga sp. YM1 TaxID=2806262 RepID=UPI00195A45D1|nr:lipopolysaccharide transport periplasmic protein LptA [Hydrogenophaga sp. YM1]QRR34644.1 lipopolysaccharide transport periplasmic protein LptA [Hydrogenophaga sp. YM1]